MHKLGLLIVTLGLGGVLALHSAAPTEALAGKPCARTEFKTDMVKAACAKGGQAEAKKVMKKFLADAKKKDASIKDCKSCHTKLAPGYDLSKDGLDKFKAAGGK